jgi:hypothetical protein
MRNFFTLSTLMTFFILLLAPAKSKALVIDHGDTLIFDYSQAIINGNQIDIPVSFHSDDTIYALDFAVKFDHNNLTFDSVINATNYIQATYFYNTSDSTLRFTSNSLHQYAVDSPLVFVRFTMLNGTITGTDINNSLALLNGDTCASLIIDSLTLGVGSINSTGEIHIFPNPANEFFIVNTDFSKLDILDMNGRTVYTNPGPEKIIQTAFLSNGFYVCRFYQDGQTNDKILVISH